MAVSAAIVSILFLVMLPMFSDTSKQITGLQEGHEVNEVALKTLNVLSRELRQANAVYLPLPIEGADPPPFAFSEDPGASCRLAFTRSVYKVAGKTMTSTEVPVEIFLGNPQEIGVDDQGKTVTTYGLYQYVDNKPEPPSGKALVEGIHEIVFWRRSATRAPSGTPPVDQPGVGSQHVHVRVRAARNRRVNGVLRTAYGTELVTMIRIRGKKL